MTGSGRDAGGLARPSRRLGALAGLLIALAWLALVASGVLARGQWAAYHLLFELRGPLAQPPSVAVVAVDEASLADLGAWPVPRTVWAELVDALLRAGATVVGLDVAFVQPGTDPAADRAFARALAAHPDRVVLAANFQPGRSLGEDRRQLVLPLDVLRRAAAFGIVDLPFDADGAIHRFPRAELGVDPEEPTRLLWHEGFAWAVARRHPGALLPAMPLGEAALIDFAGPPGAVRTLSLVSVLEAARRGDARILAGVRGRAVLVGASALRLQDQYPTPYTATLSGLGAATYMPGVEIHAHAVAGLVAGRVVRRIPGPVEALGLCALGLIAGAWLVRLSPARGALAAAGLAVTLGGMALAAFVGARVWGDVVAPLGVLATVYVASVGVQYARAETHRRLTRRTFERYVDREIVDRLLAEPWLAPRMGGEQREVTVLFSDIRSFTTISEQHTPEQVVTFLNAYLTEMATVIRAERGCIDKYIGDAILAVWGNVLPMSPEEAATHGVRAALGMLERLDACQEAWRARGFPPIAIGIGLNTGEAVVGNIGSPEKMEFGVIGDAVNVASRIEGLTKEHGALLVSGRTRELVGDAFACTFVGEIPVKGRAQPVPLWRVERSEPPPIS
ncbi:MAG: adenylate/guanylate cyclase domain-containing protein [Candidatus Sericytochromatia bacterium]|nr:adenylate/guanylate cyclase domain-containing protein [Candidatus Sericytochromatia bacterium]